MSVQYRQPLLIIGSSASGFEVITTGRAVGTKVSTGTVRVIHSTEELQRFTKGEILVSDTTVYLLNARLDAVITDLLAHRRPTGTFPAMTAAAYARGWEFTGVDMRQGTYHENGVRHHHCSWRSHMPRFNCRSRAGYHCRRWRRRCSSQVKDRGFDHDFVR